MSSRVPADLIWMSIGDAYGDIFTGDSRRFIEGLWQANYSISADTLEYINHQKRLRSIITAESSAPYGNVPVILSENENNKIVNGRVQWGFERGDHWVWVVFTSLSSDILFGNKNSGTILVGDTPFIFTSYIYESLNTGGGLYYFSCKEKDFGEERMSEFSDYFLGSEFFNLSTSISEDSDSDSRWVDFLSHSPSVSSLGIMFDVPPLDWSGVYDKVSFSGVSNWKIVAKARVDSFVDSQRKRIISFDSFGDENVNEQRIQACIESQDGKAAVKFNIHQGECIECKLESDSGISEEDLYKLLVSGNVNLEFKIIYTSERSRISGQVSVNQHVFKYNGAISIDPGKRQHNFTVFNASPEIKVFLNGIIVQDGVTWDSNILSTPERICSIGQSNLPCSSLVFAGTGFINSYTCFQKTGSSIDSVEDEEKEILDVLPVVDSIGGACVSPYNLSPTGTVISHDPSSGRVEVEIDEGWNNSFPRSVRTEIGSHLYILWPDTEYEKTDPTKNRYLIKTTTATLGTDIQSMEITLKPWYLERSEIEFVHSGLIRTRFKVPEGRMWLLEARGEEVNIYQRYGKLLEMSDDTDSEEYLDSVKGMYIGRKSHPTKSKVELSLNILLGLPFSPKGGEIGDLFEVRNIFDEIVSYAIEVGEEIEPIKPYWIDKTKISGVSVRQFETLASIGSKVDDWVTNGPLVREYAGLWEQWCTFIVSIPIEIGMSFRTAENTLKLLQEIKDVHRKFIVLQRIIEGDETLTELVDDPAEISAPMASSHSIADMVFDDDGTVTNNARCANQPSQPEYPVNGHPLYLTWETQSSDPLLFENGMLGEGRGLDGSYLLRPNVTFDDPGEIYGITYALQSTDLFNRILFRSDSARDIGRLNPIDSYEETIVVTDFVGQTPTPNSFTLSRLPIGGTISMTYWSSLNPSPGLETMTDDGVNSILGSGASSASIDFATGEITNIILSNQPEDPNTGVPKITIKYDSYESPFSKRRLRMLESNKLPSQYVEDVYGAEPVFESMTGMWNYIPRPYTSMWFYNDYGAGSDPGPLHQTMDTCINGAYGSQPAGASWGAASTEPLVTSNIVSVDFSGRDPFIRTDDPAVYTGDTSNWIANKTISWSAVGADPIPGMSSGYGGIKVISPSSIWVCGINGDVYYWDGVAWAADPVTGPVSHLNSVDSDHQSSTSVWFVGDNSHVWERDSSNPTPWIDHSAAVSLLSGAGNINDVWAPYGSQEVWVVGDGGFIANYNSVSGWTSYYDAAITQNLNGIHGYEDNGVIKFWAVGDSINENSTDYVQFLHWDGTEISTFRVEGSDNLSKVAFHNIEKEYAVPPNPIVPEKYRGHAVGESAKIYRWDGVSWILDPGFESPSYSGDLNDLFILRDDKDAPSGYTFTGQLNGGFGIAVGEYDVVNTQLGILEWS